MTTDLSTSDFAKFLQYDFQVFCNDVATHAHIHRFQYTGEGFVGTDEGFVVAGAGHDDIVF